jgi:hypothetical protein
MSVYMYKVKEMTEQDPSQRDISSEPSKLRWEIQDLHDFAEYSGSVPEKGRYISPREEDRLRQSIVAILGALSSGELVEARPLSEALELSETDNEGLLNRIAQMTDNHAAEISARDDEIAKLKESLAAQSSKHEEEILDRVKRLAAKRIACDGYKRHYEGAKEVASDVLEILSGVLVTDQESPLGSAIGQLRGLADGELDFDDVED